MYPVVPAESVAFAWQALVYLLSAMAALFGWFLMPR